MTQEASSQIVIDLPRAQAWDKLRDLSRAHLYVPGIIRTEVITEQGEGVGASRHVYRSAKKYLQETVVEWREEEGFVIRLHRGERPAPPFRAASFRYHLADYADKQTLFTATLRYEMPWGVLGAWLEKKMQKTVASTVADIAVAMKLYYETGEPTSAAALRAYKASLRQRP